jgi:hypothetical protein
MTQHAHLMDGYIAVIQGTCPEKWSRYCEIAAEMSSAEPADAETEGRNLIMRRLEMGEDTFDKALRADPEYLSIWFETLALERAFADLFVKAMRSNKVSVIAFDPGNLLDPIKITPEMMDVTMDYGAPSRVDWNLSGIRLQGRRMFRVRVTLKEALETRKGGRPTAADWDAVEKLLSDEIDKREWPTRDGEKGWQTIEDVCRWVAVILDERKESAAESTIRSRVNLMLNNIRDRRH